MTFFILKLEKYIDFSVFEGGGANNLKMATTSVFFVFFDVTPNFKCETVDSLLGTVLESNMWNCGIILKLGIVVEFHMWDPGMIPFVQFLFGPPAPPDPPKHIGEVNVCFLQKN